jgi:hypothetical protein
MHATVLMPPRNEVLKDGRAHVKLSWVIPGDADQEVLMLFG